MSEGRRISVCWFPLVMSRTALLTVGTTEFSALVSAFLAPATLAALSTHAVESALVQVGNSQLPSGFALGTTTVQGLTLELVQFVPDIDLRIARAAVVVSHAGAGSVLSVLRPVLLDGAAAPALVVVPNSSLMDSHQQDLADELRTNGWATVATVEYACASTSLISADPRPAPSLASSRLCSRPRPTSRPTPPSTLRCSPISSTSNAGSSEGDSISLLLGDARLSQPARV